MHTLQKKYFSDPAQWTLKYLVIKYMSKGPNETIFNKGEKAEEFYIILKGKLEVLSVVNGNLCNLAYLNEGETFGDLNLKVGKLRTVTIKTITNCELAYMKKSDFKIILEE